MKVTSGGRVPIPVEIWRRLGIEPGSEVAFEVEGDSVKLTPVRQPTRGERIVAHLGGRATVKMSTDEIMALTRGDQ